MTYEKPDIKALVKQGVSGWEAGRVYLREEFWRNMDQGALTSRELQALRQGVRPGRDREVYDSLTGLTDILDQAFLKAEIMALSGSLNMSRANLYMLRVLATTEVPLRFIKKWKLEREGVEAIVEAHEVIIDQCERLKALTIFLTDIYRVLDMPELSLWIKVHIESLDHDRKLHNSLLTALKSYAEEANIQVELPPPIDTKKLKPNKGVLKSYREITAAHLGKGWWSKGWQRPEGS